MAALVLTKLWRPTEVLRTDDADLMYYQISHLDGTWIAGEHDFPSVQRSPACPPGASAAAR